MVKCIKWFFLNKFILIIPYLFLIRYGYRLNPINLF
jgi:hypothetical protein